MDLIEQVRQLRTSQGLPQYLIANKAGMSRWKYAQIESGAQSGTPEEITAMARAMGFSVEDPTPQTQQYEAGGNIMDPLALLKGVIALLEGSGAQQEQDQQYQDYAVDKDKIAARQQQLEQEKQQRLQQNPQWGPGANRFNPVAATMLAGNRANQLLDSGKALKTGDLSGLSWDRQKNRRDLENNILRNEGIEPEEEAPYWQWPGSSERTEPVNQNDIFLPGFEAALLQEREKRRGMGNQSMGAGIKTRTESPYLKAREEHLNTTGQGYIHPEYKKDQLYQDGDGMEIINALVQRLLGGR